MPAFESLCARTDIIISSALMNIIFILPLGSVQYMYIYMYNTCLLDCAWHLCVKQLFSTFLFCFALWHAHAYWICSPACSHFYELDYAFEPFDSCLFLSCFAKALCFVISNFTPYLFGIAKLLVFLDHSCSHVICLHWLVCASHEHFVFRYLFRNPNTRECICG